jgi:hypothetical protein
MGKWLRKVTERGKSTLAILRFEHRAQPLATLAEFRERMIQSGVLALGVIIFSLGVGILGYHYVAGLSSWIDSIYNASMILGGMGPVDVVTSTGGKLFASVYAIYSGVALLTSVGVLLAPGLHRMLHLFHLETTSN